MELSSADLGLLKSVEGEACLCIAPSKLAEMASTWIFRFHECTLCGRCSECMESKPSSILGLWIEDLDQPIQRCCAAQRRRSARLSGRSSCAKRRRRARLRSGCCARSVSAMPHARRSCAGSWRGSRSSLRSRSALACSLAPSLLHFSGDCHEPALQLMPCVSGIARYEKWARSQCPSFTLGWLNSQASNKTFCEELGYFAFRPPSNSSRRSS